MDDLGSDTPTTTISTGFRSRLKSWLKSPVFYVIVVLSIVLVVTVTVLYSRHQKKIDAAMYPVFNRSNRINYIQQAREMERRNPPSRSDRDGIAEAFMDVIKYTQFFKKELYASKMLTPTPDLKQRQKLCHYMARLEDKLMWLNQREFPFAQNDAVHSFIDNFDAQLVKIMEQTVQLIKMQTSGASADDLKRHQRVLSSNLLRSVMGQEYVDNAEYDLRQALDNGTE